MAGATVVTSFFSTAQPNCSRSQVQEEISNETDANRMASWIRILSQK